MVDRTGESERYGRATVTEEWPAEDGGLLVLEELVHGHVVTRPAVAAGARLLGAGTRTLAESLAEPRALRTPEAGRSTLRGLRELVLGAADAVEALRDSVRHSRAHGETAGPWTPADAEELTTAAARLREVVPLLERSAGRVGGLDYTGPSWVSETDRTRALVAELKAGGAVVTYDPTEAADYHETEALGGGWLVQFTVPDDPRAFHVVVGDLAADFAPRAALGDPEVHPAVAAATALAHRDELVADRVLDPAAGDTGWIPPAAVRRPR
jgi:hypothetical protein